MALADHLGGERAGHCAHDALGFGHVTLVKLRSCCGHVAFRCGSRASQVYPGAPIPCPGDRCCCVPTNAHHGGRSRRFGDVMLALLLPLMGFALLDSVNVLNLGVTTAVVYDSRLSRRSALPSGLSFVAGVFIAITTFGVLTVLGLNFLTDRFEFDLTPTLRYWGQLVLGVVLITVAIV